MRGTARPGSVSRRVTAGGRSGEMSSSHARVVDRGATSRSVAGDRWTRCRGRGTKPVSSSSMPSRAMVGRIHVSSASGGRPRRAASASTAWIVVSWHCRRTQKVRAGGASSRNGRPAGRRARRRLPGGGPSRRRRTSRAGRASAGPPARARLDRRRERPAGGSRPIGAPCPGAPRARAPSSRGRSARARRALPQRRWSAARSPPPRVRRRAARAWATAGVGRPVVAPARRLPLLAPPRPLVAVRPSLPHRRRSTRSRR